MSQPTAKQLQRHVIAQLKKVSKVLRAEGKGLQSQVTGLGAAADEVDRNIARIESVINQAPKVAKAAKKAAPKKTSRKAA